MILPSPKKLRTILLNRTNTASRLAEFHGAFVLRVILVSSTILLTFGGSRSSIAQSFRSPPVHDTGSAHRNNSQTASGEQALLAAKLKHAEALRQQMLRAEKEQAAPFGFAHDAYQAQQAYLAEMAFDEYQAYQRKNQDKFKSQPNQRQATSEPNPNTNVRLAKPQSQNFAAPIPNSFRAAQSNEVPQAKYVPPVHVTPRSQAAIQGQPSHSHPVQMSLGDRQPVAHGKTRNGYQQQAAPQVIGSGVQRQMPRRLPTNLNSQSQFERRAAQPNAVSQNHVRVTNGRRLNGPQQFVIEENGVGLQDKIASILSKPQYRATNRQARQVPHQSASKRVSASASRFTDPRQGRPMREVVMGHQDRQPVPAARQVAVSQTPRPTNVRSQVSKQANRIASRYTNQITNRRPEEYAIQFPNRATRRSTIPAQKMAQKTSQSLQQEFVAPPRRLVETQPEKRIVQQGAVRLESKSSLTSVVQQSEESKSVQQASLQMEESQAFDQPALVLEAPSVDSRSAVPPNLNRIARQEASNFRQISVLKRQETNNSGETTNDDSQFGGSVQLGNQESGNQFGDPNPSDAMSDQDIADIVDRLEKEVDQDIEDAKESAKTDQGSRRVPEKTCEEYRSQLLTGSIRDIALDISPPASAIASREAPISRTWTDRSGNPIASGTMVDLRRGYVIVDGIDGRLKIPYGRLSDADYAAISEYWRIPATCTVGGTGVPFRAWTPQTYTWKATSLCHKPLYFENIQLERYGHTHGPFLQPVHSVGHFFVSMFSLPYQTAIHPPNECQYVLGLYRPGNCAPWLKDPIPISIDGIRRQVLITTGLGVIP